ncbi:carbohydrate-binding domain-containing protein [Candidatus Saccharibacteria bacterium]|nr:carbohydrate-binding domain-containing protein [Candidatus Saccharibacteria bacterium]
MDKMPENLPEMEKQDIAEEEQFKEETTETGREKRGTLWIIILSFALLASLGVIVWLVFSGRSDQRIHGENLNTLLGEEDDAPKAEKLDNIDPGVIVNDAEIDLTDYDSNVTITAAGEHTLTGILNNSVLINSDGKVTLNLNGVTISSVETAAIANQTSNALVVNLLENTTNTLTDGGSSVYDGALFSKGTLTVNGLGEDKTVGKLIVSGRQVLGAGINAGENFVMNSGKIMISSSDDGVRARGASFNDGVLWIKADADGVETTGDLTIVGGNLLIMSSASEKNSALKAEHDIVISGGNVVALGSGEQKSPLVSSANPATQKSLTATLNSAVSTGSTVYIKNVDTNRLVNFSTQSDFKTLVYSASTLEAGNYEISVDGIVVGTGTVE